MIARAPTTPPCSRCWPWHRYQKEKFLKPLLDGEKRVCYSMTEKAAGADATGMQTRAVKQGNENISSTREVVLIGRQRRRYGLVMAMTDPEAPRHQRYSTFIVELPNPGYIIKRDIPTMVSRAAGQGHGRRPFGDRDQGLEVPAQNLLGGEGRGLTWASIASLRPAAPWHAQRRHGQRALDMAAARVTTRSTFGRPLSERQGVQFMLADCAQRALHGPPDAPAHRLQGREGLDMRQENSIAKVSSPHGPQGRRHRDPAARGARLQPRYAAGRLVHPIRAQRLVDGPDEVHRWTVGRNVIKAYQATAPPPRPPAAILSEGRDPNERALPPRLGKRWMGVKAGLTSATRPALPPAPSLRRR